MCTFTYLCAVSAGSLSLDEQRNHPILYEENPSPWAHRPHDASAAHAGGLLNNTSLHALYQRSLARNASLAIDAAYYNPAGLVFANDGWRFSINSQTVLQRRDITASFAPFAYSANYTGPYSSQETVATKRV